MDEMKKFIEEMRQALKQAETEAARSAEPAPQTSPNASRFGHAELQAAANAPTKYRALAEAEKTYGPALMVGRIIRAAACAQSVYHDQSAEAVSRVLHDVYRDRDGAALFEARLAETRALSAGVPSEGAALIAEAFSEEFIPLLYANTALFKLGMRSVPMPNGNLTMAGLASSSTATYGAENDDTKASQPSFSSRSWQSKKLTAIVVISNDLLKSASFRADQIVRDDAAMAVGLKMDAVGIQSDGSNYEPVGLKYVNGVNVLVVNAAPTADTPAKFIRKLLASKIPLGASAKLGWIFNQDTWVVLYNLKSTTGQYYFREEMDKGLLLGKPFEISQQILTASNITDIHFGAFSEMICAQQSAMEVALSDSAAYLDSGGTIRAAFARDQTVMRLIDRHDIGPRRAAAFVRSTDVDVTSAA